MICLIITVYICVYAYLSFTTYCAPVYTIVYTFVTQLAYSLIYFILDSVLFVDFSSCTVLCLRF